MCIIKADQRNAFFAPDKQLLVAKQNIRPVSNKMINLTPTCKSNTTRPFQQAVMKNIRKPPPDSTFLLGPREKVASLSTLTIKHYL